MRSFTVILRNSMHDGHFLSKCKHLDISAVIIHISDPVSDKSFISLFSTHQSSTNSMGYSLSMVFLVVVLLLSAVQSFQISSRGSITSNVRQQLPTTARWIATSRFSTSLQMSTEGMPVIKTSPTYHLLAKMTPLFPTF